MRTSQLLLTTTRETSSEAQVISHQLMLRAGLIRQLASGIYTWLPLGLRVLHKVCDIIRQEMDHIGAQELLMPMVQPGELWQASNRWDRYGDQLLKFKDRRKHDFCLGPTHEEVITDLARNELRSYRQLPQVYYQIQTKFRDELRPRFGVMRGREFLMKDAYSFHLTQDSLDATYQAMFGAYERIFTRLGLTFRAVEADSGAIGGSHSHEFQVLADSGEDQIMYSDTGSYAANVETATASATFTNDDQHGTVQEVATPEVQSVLEVATHLKLSLHQIVKTLIVKGVKPNTWVAIVLRGDHELNEIKLQKLNLTADPLQLAPLELLPQLIGCHAGSIGPIGLDLPLIIDLEAAKMTNFVCGANKDGFHLRHVSWPKELLNQASVVDIRNVKEGDQAPDGGTIKMARGIEVGHIFKLGTKYSKALNAVVTDPSGRAQELIMGCYGIGVSRTVAAAIEQHHDERGIVWPLAMAPYQVVLIPMHLAKSNRVRELAEQLYSDLVQHGVEVLFEDRDERAGVLFADADLWGIPYRIVIAESKIDQNVVELKERGSSAEAALIPINEITNFIVAKVRQTNQN